MAIPRTQTVSVRLDPKLRYLCEIAARRQRRTISSFIEWALESILDEFSLKDANGNVNSLNQMASKLWDVEPADRFVKLAFHYPDLLNHQEEILWKLIQENGYLWRGKFNIVTNRWVWSVREEDINWGRVREEWETFNKVASGEYDKTALPAWQIYKPTAATPPDPKKPEANDMAPPPMADDEDIPF